MYVIFSVYSLKESCNHIESINNYKLQFHIDENRRPSELTPDDAWAKLIHADKILRDVDDFKEALEEYAKSSPELTFQDIEKQLRVADCTARLVALVSIFNCIILFLACFQR